MLHSIDWRLLLSGSPYFVKLSIGFELSRLTQIQLCNDELWFQFFNKGEYIQYLSALDVDKNLVLSHRYIENVTKIKKKKSVSAFLHIKKVTFWSTMWSRVVETFS